MSDGFYNFNFKYVAGGTGNPIKIIGSFPRLELKLSYSIRLSFALGTHTNDILGINAVELIRPHPTITHMISYHQWIGAN